MRERKTCACVCVREGKQKNERQIFSGWSKRRNGNKLGKQCQSQIKKKKNRIPNERCTDWWTRTARKQQAYNLSHVEKNNINKNHSFVCLFQFLKVDLSGTQLHFFFSLWEHRTGSQLHVKCLLSGWSFRVKHLRIEEEPLVTHLFTCRGSLFFVRS